MNLVFFSFVLKFWSGIANDFKASIEQVNMTFKRCTRIRSPLIFFWNEGSGLHNLSLQVTKIEHLHRQILVLDKYFTCEFQFETITELFSKVSITSKLASDYYNFPVTKLCMTCGTPTSNPTISSILVSPLSAKLSLGSTNPHITSLKIISITLIT